MTISYCLQLEIWFGLHVDLHRLIYDRRRYRGVDYYDEYETSQSSTGYIKHLVIPDVLNALTGD